MNRSKLACLIPCFNEGDNIKTLCENIEINNNQNIDWYIINNGSEDITPKEFNEKITSNIKSSNIKTFTLKNNKGPGYGIKECFFNISDEYDAICWTHADGQTPIEDVIKAHKIFLKNPGIDLLKGIRVKRDDGLIASFFTSILNIILLLILNKKSLSPNSQPTLIKSVFFKKLAPFSENDGKFDISIMFLAKNNFKNVLRFPVKFKKRLGGKGSNVHFFQKINYSLLIIFYILSKNFLSKKDNY